MRFLIVVCCGLLLLAFPALAQTSAPEVNYTPYCQTLKATSVNEAKTWRRFVEELRTPGSESLGCIRSRLVGNLKYANEDSRPQNGYSPFVNALKGPTAAIAMLPAADQCLALREFVGSIDQARGELGGFNAPESLIEWIPKRRDAKCAEAP